MPRTTLDELANGAPIALMSGGWLAPLALFWLAVWGPLRPYDAEGPLHPAPGAYALACLACVAAWWVPAGYLRPRAFERGPLYARLGVRAFRRLVPDGDGVNRLRRRRDPRFRVIGGKAAAAAFVARTEASERGHLVLLLVGVVSAVYAGRIGWAGWAAFLAAGNLVVNLYPVLLQRYTRARLREVLARGGEGRAARG